MDKFYKVYDFIEANLNGSNSIEIRFDDQSGDQVVLQVHRTDDNFVGAHFEVEDIYEEHEMISDLVWHSLQRYGEFTVTSMTKNF